jgi:lysozyme
MKTSDLLFNKLTEFEGLRLEAYLDAAGVLTIGYGHTKGVRMGDRITEYWARELLREDIGSAAARVERLGVCRTQGQLDALVSFALNVGFDRLRKSTLLKIIRRGGSEDAIRQEFMRWVHAKGTKLPGLEKRRAWEAGRFFDSAKY